MPVEIVAVGDHHDGRILHRHILHHPCGKAGHRDALAAALRVPHHPALVRTTGARCRNHLIDRGSHRVELVITGNLLDQRAVILEQHKITQVIEQIDRSQHATDQRFQFVELTQRVKHHPINRAPLHKALGIAG